MFKQKLQYLIRSAVNSGQPRFCPFCSQFDLTKVDSKFLVTHLFKCENCGLQHRHPKDDEEWLARFYQEEYNIDTHMMTMLPSDEELEKLKEESFPNLRSYVQYVSAVLGKETGKVIDYGCSWGYDVFKLQKAGFEATGYELSKPRAAFGREKLGVTIADSTDDLPKEVDLVVSSHVIEHLPRIDQFIDLAKSHLKENGIFMAFCPNGSNAYRKRDPKVWHVNWGLNHPNYLTPEFAFNAFSDNPHLILTGDWSFDPQDITSWDGKSEAVGQKQDGKELLIIAKPNITL